MTTLDDPPEFRRTWTTRIVDAFLGANFSILLILVCIGLGAAALLATPREEDPQIVVPFVDLHVEVPGASPTEAKSLAAEPLERLLSEIPGVEHVYSVSSAGGALVTVRFRVGEDREKALVNVYNKIQSNLDRVPPQVTSWLVRPVEIDDVPILALTLYDEGRGDADLRRVADEIAARLQTIPDVSRVDVHGGERRAVRVLVDPVALRARELSVVDVLRALRDANHSARAGLLAGPARDRVIEIGPFLRTSEDAESVVISSSGGRTVHVRDVARVVDGPEEVHAYTQLGFGPSARSLSTGGPITTTQVDGRLRPAVTIAVAKRKGTNAVTVCRETLAEFERLAQELLPRDVRWTVTRNQGETADEKVNELVGHLLIAIGTIVVLVGASLGWRAAVIVALAVPLTLAVTLFADLVVGYTINRVTLFALILSLGLLVDDPIVDVENIHRHLSLGRLPPRLATLFAVDEVRPPVILATLAVIVSFLPMFFVSGMMGPYMRPMPFNVPVAMLVSLVIAFTVTPWASYHLLRRDIHARDGIAQGTATAEAPGFAAHAEEEGALVRVYRRWAGWILASRRRSWLVIVAVALLFVGALGMAAGGLVPLKMLPFDNKSEFQLVVDAPEGTSLERTQCAVDDLVRAAMTIPEVTSVVSYTGSPSPHDFNGLVRHQFLRSGSHQADVRVHLVPRHERSRQAHTIALDARPTLEAVAKRHGVKLGIVEPPPGPPVLAGVVAEIRGPIEANARDFERVATDVEGRFRGIPYLRDVDTYVESPVAKTVYDVDRAEAALRGVSVVQVASTLQFALSGTNAGVLHVETERASIPLRIELARADRSVEDDLLSLSVPTASGLPVSLGELIRREETIEDRALYRKDLRDVQFVLGEAVGRSPVDAVLALKSDLARRPLPPGWSVELAGEGEWQITVDVFRDLGLAFAGALAAIYVLLVAQTGSFAISGLIMLAIPLTMIGIIPGFWLLNWVLGGRVAGFENPTFFTATGMIGMIALAGIVVRNSIILVDFVQQHRATGRSVIESCIEAGAVRLRPILLTAGAAVMGAWVIVFDPIFSGLAWSFVFGVAASTAFTLLIVPITFALTQGGFTRGAGAPPTLPEPPPRSPPPSSI